MTPEVRRPAGDRSIGHARIEWARQFGARVGPPAAALGVVVAVWQATASPRAVLVPPSSVLRALWRTRAALVGHLATTLREAVVGALIGIAVGVGLAAAAELWPMFGRAVAPVLVATQTVPLLVLGPLLVLLFGFGAVPKIVVVALVVLFPVAVATRAALSTVDAGLLDIARACGAGRLAQLRLVRVPVAAPAALAGLRVSLAYAVAGAVLGEGLGATSGLGLYIERSRRAFRYDQVLAGVVVVTACSLLLFGAVSLLERVALPHVSARRRSGPDARRAPDASEPSARCSGRSTTTGAPRATPVVHPPPNASRQEPR